MQAFAMKHGIETYPATSFVSGAIAGTAGTIASYPLDLLRTTLAAQGEPKVYKGIVDAARGIVAKNGIAGLYRGLSITIIEIIPYSALQFGLYDHMNRLWSLRKVRSLISTELFASASLRQADSQYVLRARREIDRVDLEELSKAWFVASFPGRYPSWQPTLLISLRKDSRSQECSERSITADVSHSRPHLASGGAWLTSFELKDFSDSTKELVHPC